MLQSRYLEILLWSAGDTNTCGHDGTEFVEEGTRTVACGGEFVVGFVGAFLVSALRSDGLSGVSMN